LFNKHDDEKSDEFKLAYEEKLSGLKKHFDDNFSHPYANNLNLIILLFPVPSKVELVKRLHNKLALLQQVGD
jgi:hypothetical protein